MSTQVIAARGISWEEVRRLCTGCFTTLGALFVAGFPLLVFGVCVFVSARMSPGYTDEAIYHYDAWAAWKANGPVPQSFTPFIHQGYVLGLPYLFFDNPGFYGIRVWSFTLWMFSFLCFYYAYARRLKEVWVVPLLSGFFFTTLYVGTLSYQSLPFVLTTAAAGLFLLATEKKNSGLSDIAAFLCPLFFTLPVLTFLPAVPASGVMLVCGLVFVPWKKRKLLCVLGTFISVLLIGYLFYLERQYSEVTILPTRSTELSSLIGGLERWFLQVGQVSGLHLIRGVGFSLAFAPLIFSQAVRSWFVRHMFIFLSYCAALLFAIAYVLFLEDATYPAERRFLFIQVHRYAALVLPTLLLLHYQKFKFSFVAWLPILWLAMMGALAGMVGSLSYPYYIHYTVPALSGLLIMLLASLVNQHAKYGWTKFVLVLPCVALTYVGCDYVVNRGYSGRGALKGEYAIPSGGDYFRYSYADQRRASSLNQAGQLYRDYDCDNSFFAAIDRLPLLYLVAQRASPFGDVWAKTRLGAVFEIIREQNRVCLFYRAGKNRIRGNPDATIFDHLKLPPESYKVIAHKLVREGYMFLAYKKKRGFRTSQGRLD